MDNRLKIIKIDSLYVPTLQCSGQHCGRCVQWEPIPFQDGGGKCLTTRKNPNKQKIKTVLTFPAEPAHKNSKNETNGINIATDQAV